MNREDTGPPLPSDQTRAALKLYKRVEESLFLFSLKEALEWLMPPGAVLESSMSSVATATALSWRHSCLFTFRKLFWGLMPG